MWVATQTESDMNDIIVIDNDDDEASVVKSNGNDNNDDDEKKEETRAHPQCRSIQRTRTGTKPRFFWLFFQVLLRSEILSVLYQAANEYEHVLYRNNFVSSSQSY
jgi:hypothetical protein